MAIELPDYIDPRRMAEQGLALKGDLSAQKLSRLPEPFRARQPVHVKLSFDLDEGRVCIRGSITTVLDAICQRCLRRMRLEIAPRLDAVLLSEHAAAERGEDEERDVLVAADGPLRLANLVEDEILLAVPMVPVHDDGACMLPHGAVAAPPIARVSPFADLAERLKHRNTK